jgi:ppGpp synthetase/RelA/SpoT-type nucleotidyltranferase
MIIPKDIAQNYNYLEPYFIKVKEIVDQTLINYSSQNLFAYSSRIKALDSLAEKIESGRYKDWNSVDDFVGAVIIIPSITYEPKILRFLETSFMKVEIKKRGSTLKSSDVFRFDTTRFIGKLRPIGNGEIINTINFEVQIRSAFEHAWSVTTHDLAYKSKTIDWKILRLAAQLKSSVEQLDMITLGALDIKNSIQEHKWPETDLKLKICNCFDNFFEDNLVDISVILTPQIGHIDPPWVLDSMNAMV